MLYSPNQYHYLPRKRFVGPQVHAARGLRMQEAKLSDSTLASDSLFSGVGSGLGAGLASGNVGAGLGAGLASGAGSYLVGKMTNNRTAANIAGVGFGALGGAAFGGGAAGALGGAFGGGIGVLGGRLFNHAPQMYRIHNRRRDYPMARRMTPMAARGNGLSMSCPRPYSGGLAMSCPCSQRSPTRMTQYSPYYSPSYRMRMSCPCSRRSPM